MRRPSGVIPRASAILVAQNGLGTRAPDKNRERLECSIPTKRCNTGMSTDTPPRTTVCLGLVVMQRVGPGTYMDESARLTRLLGLMEGVYNMFTQFRPTNSVLAGEVAVLGIARRRPYPYTRAQAAGASCGDFQAV